MSIIIFIIIIAILIFVHELGHFLFAKKTGMKVEEFSIGFPPRIFSWRRGETLYSINLIPFGGFVKILGENPLDDATEKPLSEHDKKRIFSNKPRWAQALVLFAGVLFNLIFAWIIIVSGFIFGMPVPADYKNDDGSVINSKLIVSSVLVGSPAEIAGLKTADQILSVSTKKTTLDNPETADVINLVSQTKDNESVTVKYDRSGNINTIEILPKTGVVSGGKAIGIAMERVGILKLSFPAAIIEGTKVTYLTTNQTAMGIATLFCGQNKKNRNNPTLIKTIVDCDLRTIFKDRSRLSQIAGPIGIVKMVGNSSELGFGYLISFMAMISINLAVINLLPIPALDGGRILFVLIESIIRRKISANFQLWANGIGFGILILLMILVTVSDIWKLF